jgi:hypothetical protein
MTGRTPANDNEGPAFTLTVSQLEELIAKAICVAADKGIIGGGIVLLDKQELARALSCSPSSVDRLRRLGMPTVRLASQVVRFEPAKVIEWLRERKQQA